MSREKIVPKKFLKGFRKIQEFLETTYSLKFGNFHSINKVLVRYGFPIKTIAGSKYASEEDIAIWIKAMMDGNIYEDFTRAARKNKRQKLKHFPIKNKGDKSYSQADIINILWKFDKTYEFQEQKSKDFAIAFVRRMLKNKQSQKDILFCMRKMFYAGITECGKEVRTNRVRTCLVDIKE